MATPSTQQHPSAPEPKKDFRLVDWAKEQLNGAGHAKIGTGEISAIGVEFFDDQNRVHSAYANSVVSLDTIISGLIAKGLYNTRPAYRATVMVNGHATEFFLSEHHTRRVLGTAPALRQGDQIDVIAIKTTSTSGVAFGYSLPMKK